MAQFISNLQLPPAGFMYNFICSWSNATTLTVTGGIARDDNNNVWIAQGTTFAGHSSTALTIGSTVSGAGGVDTGDIAASSRYAVLVISDSSGFHQPAAMLTLVGALGVLNPTMPLGYDSYALVSYAFTDSSSEFIQFLDFGAANVITKLWVNSIRVLNAGSVDSAITSISAAAAAVPYSGLIIEVTFIPATADDTVNVQSYGTTGFGGRIVSGPVAAKAATMEMSKVFVDGNTTFAYTNSAASCSSTIHVAGFEFQV